MEAILIILILVSVVLSAVSLIHCWRIKRKLNTGIPINYKKITDLIPTIIAEVKELLIKQASDIIEHNNKAISDLERRLKYSIATASGKKRDRHRPKHTTSPNSAIDNLKQEKKEGEQ